MASSRTGPQALFSLRKTIIAINSALT